MQGDVYDRAVWLVLQQQITLFGFVNLLRKAGSKICLCSDICSMIRFPQLDLYLKWMNIKYSKVCRISENVFGKCDCSWIRLSTTVLSFHLDSFVSPSAALSCLVCTILSMILTLASKVPFESLLMHARTVYFHHPRCRSARFIDVLCCWKKCFLTKYC
jgi:hypothetical protein